MVTDSAPPWPGASTSGSDQARLRSDKLRIPGVVWQLCQMHGIRALAAGGPIFVQLGLVSPRVSPTAIVIVEPFHRLHLVMVLEEAGWSLTTPGRTRGFLPLVFVRLEYPALVCPIDIYDIFPGFYAAPAEGFEQLWKRRVDLSLAGVAVPLSTGSPQCSLRVTTSSVLSPAIGVRNRTSTNSSLCFARI